MIYCNENNKGAADWLTKLSQSGLIGDLSQKSGLTTCEVTHAATSSPGSEAGNLPCNSLAGQTIGLFGQDRARVSRSARQAVASLRATKDTCGQSSSDSSASVALQLFLESRLIANLASYGSPEYALNWKRLDMPLGAPVCALRASVRRTSDNGYSGWPTPTARDYKDTGDLSTSMIRKDGRLRMDTIPRLVFGLNTKVSNAETKKHAALNPALIRWLMGYPEGWYN